MTLKKYIDFVRDLFKKDEVKPIVIPTIVQEKVEKPKRKYTKRKQNGITIPKV